MRHRGLVTRVISYALLGLIILTGSSKLAVADILFTFTGTTGGSLIYNNVDPSTPIPFTQPPEPVFAQIDIHTNFTGSFSSIGSNVPVSGFVRFGDPITGPTVLYQDFMGSNVQAVFPAMGGTSPIISADFCCNIFPPSCACENGQVAFGGDSFTATYRPTGQSNSNVKVTGSGTWTAQQIPEPSSAAALLSAFLSMLGIFGLTRMRSWR